MQFKRRQLTCGGVFVIACSFGRPTRPLNFRWDCQRMLVIYRFSIWFIFHFSLETKDSLRISYLFMHLVHTYWLTGRLLYLWALSLRMQPFQCLVVVREERRFSEMDWISIFWKKRYGQQLENRAKNEVKVSYKRTSLVCLYVILKKRSFSCSYSWMDKKWAYHAVQTKCYNNWHEINQILWQLNSHSYSESPDIWRRRRREVIPRWIRSNFAFISVLFSFSWGIAVSTTTANEKN